MIEVGFYNLLAADSSIAALCGNRIYPVQLPEGSALPAITYLYPGGSSQPTLNTTGYQRQRLEINCWGATYPDAVTLRGTVRTALEGTRAVLSDGTDLQDIEFIQPIDFPFETDAREYRCAIEFYLHFNLQ